MDAVPDRIEKEIRLQAPRARVWAAISDAREFGAWFGMTLDAPFVAGKAVTGRIAPTTADPDIAKLQEPHAGTPFELYIETIEPERRFAFRWHPFAIDRTVDYSTEATTLVTFDLEDADGGTRLRLTESGFSRIPLARRKDAFTANDGGWTLQMGLIGKYLAAHVS
jgi:uncharacterized protein YndB with AHSA1/START domain